MVENNENDLIARRRQYLQQLRVAGDAFPNDFKRDHLALDLHQDYAAYSQDALAAASITVAVAGRMMSRRVMGKLAFAHLQDASGRIQLYIKKDALSDAVYADFKQWSIGDILGACGKLVKTKTGELSVQVETVRLLTKSLRPLPEKFHGLTDKEQCYRQRYLDLLFNEKTRTVFSVRSHIIQFLRDYFNARHFVEVETPMMHPIPGGATARPFVTHHNSLDTDFYLRIAPELYLKRLVVGGMERVFEVNRSFRNEGLSLQHNPEFTLLEFYQAYADYNDLMDLIEELLRSLAIAIKGSAVFCYQGKEFDLKKRFKRMGLIEAILHFNEGIGHDQLTDIEQSRMLAERLQVPLQPDAELGKIHLELFEKTVEKKLEQPTFITAYPTVVSPLARKNNKDPSSTDRFEFFIGGRELANGFSELNDPEDQAQRFQQQLKEKAAGNAEAMHCDDDYITALEYGMPPTAGAGIGIDRLVMLLTDAASIRDVILFPQLRPKDNAAVD